MNRKVEFEIYGSKCIVEFDDTPEMRQELFDKVLAFYFEHESFSGEGIMQSDGPLIAAPELISDIADDIFKFKTTWPDDAPAPKDGE